MEEYRSQETSLVCRAVLWRVLK